MGMFRKLLWASDRFESNCAAKQQFHNAKWVLLLPLVARKTLYIQYLWHSIKPLVVILCFSATMIYFHLWRREQSSSCCTCDWGLILKPPTQENSPFSVDSQPTPRLSSLNRFALLQFAALLPPPCRAPACSSLLARPHTHACTCLHRLFTQPKVTQPVSQVIYVWDSLDYILCIFFI